MQDTFVGMDIVVPHKSDLVVSRTGTNHLEISGDKKQSQESASNAACHNRATSQFTVQPNNQQCKCSLLLHVDCQCMKTNTRPFKCGGCSKLYKTICKLHEHLDQVHGDSESYFFNKITQTAFLRYGSSCKVTQTDSENMHNNNIKIFVSDSVVEVDRDQASDFPSAEKNNDRNLNAAADVISYLKEEDSFDFGEAVVDSETQDLTELGKRLDCLKEQYVIVKIENEETEEDNISDESLPSIHKKELKDQQRPKRTKNVTKKKRTVNNKKQKVAGRCSRSEQRKRETVKCQHCTLNFQTVQDLKLHKTTEHLNTELKCNICDRQFTYKKALKRHGLIHEGLAPHSCDNCEKQFRTLAELNFHKTVHSDVKNFICQYCGEAVSTASILRKHIQKCQDIRPFCCPRENCGRAFRLKHSLMLHEQSHRGEQPYMCEVCGSGFTRSFSLQTHMYVHTGERPYKCDKCPKAFSNKEHLRRHLRTHTRDLPYICHCGKAFAQNWNLKAHLRQHTGEKPYVCDVCGAGFKHNVSRKNHMKVHTGVISLGQTET